MNIIQHSLQTLTRNFPRRETLKREKGWEGIIEILLAEHNCLLSLLDTLKDAADKLRPGKVPDYPLLKDIIDYLTYYPDQYHHPRENMVFGNLAEKIAGFDGKLGHLIREHEELARLNRKLLDELKAISSGRPARRKLLHDDILRYISDYQHHLQFEKREIFPLAEGEIAQNEWRKIKAKTRFVDDPLFGDHLNQKYVRLEKAIRTSLGDLGNSVPPTEFAPFDLLVKGISSFVGLPLRLSRSLNPCKSGD